MYDRVAGADRGLGALGRLLDGDRHRNAREHIAAAISTHSELPVTASPMCTAAAHPLLTACVFWQINDLISSGQTTLSELISQRERLKVWC
jgi:hypothetical protein